jgi:hypothetical protein
MKKALVGLALLAIAFITAAQFLTVYVVPPIGAIPEGRTIVIARTGEMQFIESPDGMCLRLQGGVSLLCRGMALASLDLPDRQIFLRLPYSEFLYLRSTGGQKFDR